MVDRKDGGRAELEPASDGLHRRAAAIQEKTAVIPDYNTTFAGIVGSGAILLAVFGASCLFRAGQKRNEKPIAACTLVHWDGDGADRPDAKSAPSTDARAKLLVTVVFS